MHLADFLDDIRNVSSVFFGYPEYSSVTKMLFELGLRTSFSTLIHNSKVLPAGCPSVLTILYDVFCDLGLYTVCLSLS